VPNLHGHAALEPAHLLAFTVETLEEVLLSAGFGIVKKESHGRPRSRLIPLYITVLARAEANGKRAVEVRSSGKGVRFRRRLSTAWRMIAGRYLTRWAWLPWPEIDEEEIVEGVEKG
jgi:hypothetical protein